MAFKITGQNIYFRKAQESDMSTLATAADFSLGSVSPNSDKQKYYWYRENIANGNAVTAALASNSGFGSMFLTICLKSDDSIIGYHRFVYIDQKVESKFTAIIPSLRSAGHYKEAGTLRHKFYFQGLQATHAEMKLPTDIDHYLDTLYTTTDRSQAISSHGNWRWSTISSSNWTTWIDHSDQSTEKSHTYSLTWS
jgi:hypothetical protein